ncbi:microtubule-associated protein 10 [Dunckerocampus dactyliophorus]|uniref:microtubule-associated protein 10 n=1 Tax=Dunckerocampus dactyliophorus TaxID=161453 RepID=UPI00240766C8|nr:microtubule-associated protein 10 [Dunckerocampus dactyliophorus]
MSKQHGGNLKQETLFSFELIVEYIQVDSDNTVSDALAVGVRLLDFPTLLIYPPDLRGDDATQHQQNNHHAIGGLYSFNRGKSCFFQMNLDTLHTQLSNTPLYLMILDVKEDIPKLVGTSLISLAKIMDRIRQDANDHGVSTCSSYGERGLVCINNLAEETVGSISLSFKLLIVGASLLTQVTKSIPVYREQSAQEVDMKNSSKIPSGCKGVQLPTLDNPDRDILNSGNNVDRQAVSTQTEHDPIIQIPHTIQEDEKGFDEDLAVFCPPRLYYCNPGKEKTQGVQYKLFKPDSKFVTHKDTFSENESDTSSVMDKSVEPAAEIPVDHQASVNRNVLEEALRPLPLLNALLVELSQLNVQNLHQQQPNHPNLARICRPAFAEPSHGQGGAKMSKSRPLQETTQGGSHLKHLYSPRDVSPQNVKHASENNKKEALTESKAHRKKLVYGTTRTFNLRLQKHSTVVKHRECMMTHMHNELQSSKGKTKCPTKSKSSVSKENLKKTQNVEAVSVVQDTTPLLKRADESVSESPKQDSEYQHISIPIPRVACQDDATNYKLPETNQAWPKSESLSDESSRSSRHSSHRSLLSDSSREGTKVEDYIDDFDSFEASDADTTSSSPEHAQAEPPKAPVLRRFRSSESGSESVRERPLLPAPIRAHSPLHRVLRGTHIIRTLDSALRFSSDEEDKEGSATVHTVHSQKEAKEGGSGAKSHISLRGQRSESDKSSSNIQQNDSQSECSDSLEAEEMEDELGSLDLRNEYQHISELVACKLPGYTM